MYKIDNSWVKGKSATIGNNLKKTIITYKAPEVYVGNDSQQQSQPILVRYVLNYLNYGRFYVNHDSCLWQPSWIGATGGGSRCSSYKTRPSVLCWFNLFYWVLIWCMKLKGAVLNFTSLLGHLHEFNYQTNFWLDDFFNHIGFICVFREIISKKCIYYRNSYFRSFDSDCQQQAFCAVFVLSVSFVSFYVL